MRQLWLDADLHRDRLALDAAQAKRLRRVLRLRDGDRVRVADGRGATRLYELGDSGLQAKGPRSARPAPARRVHVGVGLLKGDRQSWLLQKLVEAGADVIAPLQLTHCVVKLDDKRAQARAERWQAVVVEAFEQCGRVALPAVAPVRRLAGFLGALPPSTALAFADARDAAAATPNPWTVAPSSSGPVTGGPVTGDSVTSDPVTGGPVTGGAAATDDGAPPQPDGQVPALLDWVDTSSGDVAIVVGPEGGLSEAERALLSRAGAVPVHLGAHVLRAETAAVVAAWGLRQRVDG